MLSSNIFFFSSDVESMEGFSRSSVMLFQELMQIFVIEFIPYVTLLKGGIYKHSALLNLVGLIWISLHLWKKFSKDLGSFPFKKEWTKRQFWISTIPLILSIFHFLYNGEDGSCNSENEMIRKAFFWSFWILSLISSELDWNHIWQPWRRCANEYDNE